MPSDRMRLRGMRGKCRKEADRARGISPQNGMSRMPYHHRCATTIGPACDLKPYSIQDNRDRCSLLFDRAQLLEARQIVLETPVLDNLSVLHAVKIESLEIDCLATSLDVLELPGEMPLEMQMKHRAIADDRHVVDIRRQIGNGGAKIL